MNKMYPRYQGRCISAVDLSSTIFSSIIRENIAIFDLENFKMPQGASY